MQGLLNMERRHSAPARPLAWPLVTGLAALAASARSAVLVALASATLLAVSSPADARRGADDLPAVALSSLPPEARDTDRLIHAGGPFPYPHKDGTVFGNRERILPKRPRGEYREYTVKTPGSRDRGARRIVCAGKEPRTPEVCYYTADHYASFQRITR